MTKDAQAFDREVSPRDPAFRVSATQIYRNLSAMPLASLGFAVTAPDQALPKARQAVLGGAAFTQRVMVSWRLTDEDYPAQHVIWLTFVPTRDSVEIGGVTDGPTGRIAQPLWLLEPVSTTRKEQVTVLAGPGRPAGPWVAAGLRAAAAVRARVPARHWSGRLVLEVPSSQQVFERLLGVAPNSYASIAAVAWPEGPMAARAAVRIVLNPELMGRLDDQTREVLLTHEATHVATRSVASPAPTWLVEGYADYVAYSAFSRTAGQALAPLLASVRAHGASRALPGNDEFRPGAPHLSLSYTQAWSACRYLAQNYSATSLSRFYLQVDSRVPLDRALRAVFGISEARFTRDWAAALHTAAWQTRRPG